MGLRHFWRSCWGLSSVLPVFTFVASGSVQAASEVSPGSAEKASPVLEFKRDAVRRASEFARNGETSAAAAVVEEVAKRSGRTDPFPDELRGTVLVLERNYEAAEKSFRVMLSKDPESYIGQFNLAESIFLQHRFEEAERVFSAVESQRSGADPALADLCRFKRVVCLAAAGLPDRAEQLLPKADDTPPSPAVQYSRAAIQYVKKAYLRAGSSVEAARKKFSPEVESVFTDSFVELGWGTRTKAGQFNFSAAK